MIRRALVTLLVGVTSFVIASVAAAGAAPTERIVLDPLGGARVKASAVVGQAGPGTRVSLMVSGARPGSHLRAVLNAGTCKTRSASFASAGMARSDTHGRASWVSALRFHSANVRWADVSDGAHVLVLIIDGKPAACGAIPGMK